MNYSPVSPQMTIGDLVKNPAYGLLSRYIFTYMTPDHYYASLDSLGFKTAGFVPGLHRLEELAASDRHEGSSYIHRIYSAEDCLANYDKAAVALLHFPSKIRETESFSSDIQTPASVPCTPYVLVIPGGAFNRQWGFIEGQAIAAALNEMGYTAFVLYYRTKQEPLMPKPIEDMHRAVAYIEEHAASFRIQKGHYMIGGFSAGACLAQEIASDNFGYASRPAVIKAGSAGQISWKPEAIPAPEAIFLAYTACSNMDSYYRLQKLPADSPQRAGMSPFLRRIGGPSFDEQSLEPFEILRHIDSSYPRTYLLANEDDDVVPVVNTRNFDAKLNELGVAHICRIGRTGGHSFGLGIGLELEGWLEEAVQFWQNASLAPTAH